MKTWLAAAALTAFTSALAAGGEPVPLYTNEDLDRMFGAPLPAVTEPVDKSTPQDWEWVETFLDRQHAQLEADRQYDLQRRAADLVERHEDRYNDYYDQSFILPGAWYWPGTYLGWRGGAWHNGWQGSGGGWHGIPGMRPINTPHPTPHVGGGSGMMGARPAQMHGGSGRPGQGR